MPQAERGDGFGHAPWLGPVNRFGTSLGDRAKAAAPRADIAEQHEGRGVMVPAFSDIRALRRLANGMQAKAAGQLLQVVKVLAHRSPGLEPRGLRAQKPGAEFNLDELGSGRHDEI